MPEEDLEKMKTGEVAERARRTSPDESEFTPLLRRVMEMAEPHLVEEEKRLLQALGKETL